MVDSTAYLLISHGSRDPRPKEAMNRLANLVRAQLVEMDLARPHLESPSPQAQHAPSEPLQPFPNEVTPSKGRTVLLTRPKVQTSPPSDAIAQVMVGTACLELAPMSLSEQIYEFGTRVTAAGIKKLKLMPVFLMSGVHVKEDIPQEVNAAKKLLAETGLQLVLCPHLGSHNKISDVLASRMASVPSTGSLLVAHGSRRPKGNKVIQRLAERLNTQVAYWSTPPDIETQVIHLMQQGCQQITILPYFLFAGGITDAIAYRTEELAERFPKVNFRLLPTLGATDEIASLAVELIYQ
ncbi:MAG: CbiX/SirB N-terminal domain-containing protein [Cyanobacteria bacterium P01_D01_bin.105]